MGETRINLKHWLEDLRDSYPYSLEEAILVELIANSLDAKPSEIRFSTDAREQTLTQIDNGVGMVRDDLQKYHDIAATTKERGKGIGWAGIGAKLSLLVAKDVHTETKQFGKDAIATRWHLENEMKAPWDSTSPLGLLAAGGGTAVKICLKDEKSALLNPAFITRTIQMWFCPLLESEFMAKRLWIVYPGGVTFVVNGRRVGLPQKPGLFDFLVGRNKPKPFDVRLGKRGKVVGAGFLRKSNHDLEEGERGLTISVYGKVVRRGWEWIDISPRDQKRVWGMVEIPELSAILTTNKLDFRKDASSMQVFYRYRRAVQGAIEPILRQMGELIAAQEREEIPRTLEKDIQHVLQKLLPDYPELEPLAGRQPRGEHTTAVLPDLLSPLIGSSVQGVGTVTGDKGGVGQGGGVEAGPGLGLGERIDPQDPPNQRGRVYQGRQRLPSIVVDYENKPEREELGWLEGVRLCINKGHPAYRKVADHQNQRLENYHTLNCIALVLSQHLGEGRSVQGFIGSFWRAWGGRET